MLTQKATCSYAVVSPTLLLRHLENISNPHVYKKRNRPTRLGEAFSLVGRAGFSAILPKSERYWVAANL
jgi:hypothetical protein